MYNFRTVIQWITIKLAIAIWFLGTASAVLADEPFQPLFISAADLQVMPESERWLKRFILGFEPNWTGFFRLSQDGFGGKTNPNDPRTRKLWRQLYWLFFELMHGQIMRYAPPQTQFFVAIPDRRTNSNLLGNEEEVFREYLAERAGWSAKKISEQVKFFRISTELLYPQDIASILGRDSHSRLVMGIGIDADKWYLEPLHKLVKTFSNDFVLQTLKEVNTEGGDIELAWMPEGKVGLLVGAHRIYRWVLRNMNLDLSGTILDTKTIEAAASSFRRAFFDVEVLIVGKEGLRNPQLISDDLFHLDMIVNVVRNEHEVLAFVPSYDECPIDAYTLVKISKEVRERCQLIYDRTARQMARRGYKVVRLPFADHPVRSPVNVAKFIDPVSHRQTILLGKYPYPFPLANGRNPQYDLQTVFNNLIDVVNKWRLNPTKRNWAEFSKTIAYAWSVMDKTANLENPDFSRQMAAYIDHGINVIPIPIFPVGAGGLHCLLK